MTAKPRKKSSTKPGIVPVLFTLGVIGWGFFAIDRLTSSSAPDYETDQIESQDLSQNASEHTPAWKKSAESFLTRFQKKDGIELKNAEEYESWHAVLPDENSPESTQENVQPEGREKTGKNATGRVSEYVLYFYKENASGLSLTPVSQTSDNISYTEVFRSLIEGPGRNGGKLVDSFPVKPSVIDVQREQDTLILNLDDNFGHGISFETAELQIKQFIKTASQFKGLKKLQVMINSRQIENISIDGLTMPSTFRIH